MKKITILLMTVIVLQLTAQEKFSDLNKLQVTTTGDIVRVIGTKINENSFKSSIITPVKIDAKVNKDEEKEFEILMQSENQQNKKEFAATMLNELLNSDENNELSLLLVKNTSNCNMVLHVEGKNNYSLPIPANGQNGIMVEKGFYQLKGNVCELKYESQKDLNKNLLVALKWVENK